MASDDGREQRSKGRRRRKRRRAEAHDDEQPSRGQRSRGQRRARRRARANKHARFERALGSMREERSLERGGRYEFDYEQDVVLTKLSGRMRFVGTVALVGCVLGLVSMFLQASELSRLPGQAQSVLALLLLVSIGAIVVAGIVAALTLRAARSFRWIVQSEGDDIHHLMAALRDLDKIYLVQMVLVIVGFLVFGLTLMKACL